jgi:hypothetical protein
VNLLRVRKSGVLGYAAVFTKIDLCRAHHEKVGLGAGLWISSSARK